MTLCDAGPQVALVSSSDRNHNRCLATLPSLPLPLLTTWPAFSEAMYLLGKSGGYRAQNELWVFVRKGVLIILPSSETELTRMDELMKKYRDTPMDLADASLVAVAETLDQKRIFTVDSDFFVYRLQDGTSLEVVPSL